MADAEISVVKKFYPWRRLRNRPLRGEGSGIVTEKMENEKWENGITDFARHGSRRLC
jgi:hypothetical protein